MINFEEHYQSIYQERWPALRASLLEAQARAGFPRPNRFLAVDAKLAPIYTMDSASILAAEALEVDPGHSVLDACASPGGKALILAEKLFLDSERSASSSLELNEPSRARRHRLEGVLDQYLPAPFRTQIKLLSIPAERLFKKRPETYDRILADAPCSSEAHVLSDPQALAEWTPARPRGLAQRQYAILCSLLECLKPGGRLIYSTCSIHPEENDGVIERVLERAKKKNHPVELADYSIPSMGEKTKYGWSIFPDRAFAGPIFFSALKRNS